MKITTKIIAVSAFALNLAVAAPIDDIGALSVQGTQVVGANGQPAQLRGMSFFWNIGEEAAPYWNANVVNWLAEDWHANLVRAAMAVEDWWGDSKGYLYEPQKNQAMVETIVDAAIAKGIYVIIDWHSHFTNDNSNGKQDSAVNFFSRMAQKYGQYPNVIYEIYNEPQQISWSNDIKPYAEKIIPVIRQYDPDNLIVVGTPWWSGRPDEAAQNPISGENAKNVAYTFHFYASDNDHLNNFLPAAKSASQTIPLFVTECGLTQNSGTGTINYNMVNTFFDWIEQNKISWAAWSIVNKDETSAALQKSASASGNWSESDLRESGTWFRNKLRELNPEWTPISGGGGEIPPAALSRPVASTSSFLFANNTVSVNLKGQSKVELLDLQGRTVRTLWNGNVSGSVSLSVSTQPGIYLVRIQGQGVSETHKVAVK